MPPSNVNLDRFKVNSLLHLLILKLTWIFEAGDEVFVWTQGDWHHGVYLGVFRRTERCRTVSFLGPDDFIGLTDIPSILSAIGSVLRVVF